MDYELRSFLFAVDMRLAVRSRSSNSCRPIFWISYFLAFNWLFFLAFLLELALFLLLIFFFWILKQRIAFFIWNLAINQSFTWLTWIMLTFCYRKIIWFLLILRFIWTFVFLIIFKPIDKFSLIAFGLWNFLIGRGRSGSNDGSGHWDVFDISWARTKISKTQVSITVACNHCFFRFFLSWQVFLIFFWIIWSWMLLNGFWRFYF